MDIRSAIPRIYQIKHAKQRLYFLNCSWHCWQKSQFSCTKRSEWCKIVSQGSGNIEFWSAALIKLLSPDTPSWQQESCAGQNHRSTSSFSTSATSLNSNNNGGHFTKVSEKIQNQINFWSLSIHQWIGSDFTFYICIGFNKFSGMEGQDFMHWRQWLQFLIKIRWRLLWFKTFWWSGEIPLTF